MLAAQVAGLPRVKAKRTIEPTAEALLAATQGYRERSQAAGCEVERVIATDEAGWFRVLAGALVGNSRHEDARRVALGVPFDRRHGGPSPMRSKTMKGYLTSLKAARYGRALRAESDHSGS